MKKKYRGIADGVLYHYVTQFIDLGVNSFVFRYWVPWKRRWAYEVVSEHVMDLKFGLEKDDYSTSNQI